jgi:hypothetical protein
MYDAAGPYTIKFRTLPVKVYQSSKFAASPPPEPDKHKSLSRNLALPLSSEFTLLVDIEQSCRLHCHIHIVTARDYHR